jgi:hypothetical protein
MPSPADVAYGDMVRSHWMSLAVNGTAAPGWWATTAVPQGSGAAFTAALLGGAQENNGATLVNVPDFKLDLCAQLAAWGIDQRFWWIN